MTDTPEPVATTLSPGAARYLSDMASARERLATFPDGIRQRLEAWQEARSEWFNDTMLEVVSEFAEYEATHATGNPFIDLDVGSITVPIGYVRKMVEALGIVAPTLDYLPHPHCVTTTDAVREALELGQSVITAFDQEAERG